MHNERYATAIEVHADTGGTCARRFLFANLSAIGELAGSFIAKAHRKELS
jgi:hypothetical protein